MPRRRCCTYSATIWSCADRSSGAVSGNAVPALSSLDGQAIRSCITPRQRHSRRRDHHAGRSRHAGDATSYPAGVHRRAGGSVWFLFEWRHPHRQGISRQEPARQRRADSAGAVWCVVPLFRQYEDAEGDHPLREREDRMTPQLTSEARRALGRAGFSAAPSSKARACWSSSFASSALVDEVLACWPKASTGPAAD